MWTILSELSNSKMYNRPLGGFGQGWQGNNRGRGGWNQRGGGGGGGMYGRGGYPNRGGMRPQSWGPMPNAPMGSYGNQWSSNTNPGEFIKLVSLFSEHNNNQHGVNNSSSNNSSNSNQA